MTNLQLEKIAKSLPEEYRNIDNPTPIDAEPDTKQFPMSVTCVTRDGNENTIHDVCAVYVKSDGNLEVYDGGDIIAEIISKEIKIVEEEK